MHHNSYKHRKFVYFQYNLNKRLRNENANSESVVTGGEEENPRNVGPQSGKSESLRTPEPSNGESTSTSNCEADSSSLEVNPSSINDEKFVISKQVDTSINKDTFNKAKSAVFRKLMSKHRDYGAILVIVLLPKNPIKIQIYLNLRVFSERMDFLVNIGLTI